MSDDIRLAAAVNKNCSFSVLSVPGNVFARQVTVCAHGFLHLELYILQHVAQMIRRKSVGRELFF